MASLWSVEDQVAFLRERGTQIVDEMCQQCRRQPSERVKPDTQDALHHWLRERLYASAQKCAGERVEGVKMPEELLHPQADAKRVAQEAHAFACRTKVRTQPGTLRYVRRTLSFLTKWVKRTFPERQVDMLLALQHVTHPGSDSLPTRIRRMFALIALGELDQSEVARGWIQSMRRLAHGARMPMDRELTDEETRVWHTKYADVVHRLFPASFLAEMACQGEPCAVAHATVHPLSLEERRAWAAHHAQRENSQVQQAETQCLATDNDREERVGKTAPQSPSPQSRSVPNTGAGTTLDHALAASDACKPCRQAAQSRVHAVPGNTLTAKTVAQAKSPVATPLPTKTHAHGSVPAKPLLECQESGVSMMCFHAQDKDHVMYASAPDACANGDRATSSANTHTRRGISVAPPREKTIPPHKPKLVQKRPKRRRKRLRLT